MIDDRINDQRSSMEIVKADAVYHEVKSFQPVYTDESKTVMMERREELHYKIRGIQQTYGEIVAKYEQAEKDIARAQGEMIDVVKTNEDMDREMAFPVDGVHALERTREDVGTRKAEAEKWNTETTKAKEALVGQQARVGVGIEQFKKEFPEETVVAFDMELEAIADFLQETKQKLTERKTYIEAETKRIEGEMGNIVEAYQQLDRFAEAHHFNRSIVIAIPLTEKELIDFTYERMKFVNKITSELRVKKEDLEAGKEKIDRAKRYFRA